MRRLLRLLRERDGPRRAAPPPRRPGAPPQHLPARHRWLRRRDADDCSCEGTEGAGAHGLRGLGRHAQGGRGGSWPRVSPHRGLPPREPRDVEPPYLLHARPPQRRGCAGAPQAAGRGLDRKTRGGHRGVRLRSVDPEFGFLRGGLLFPAAAGAGHAHRRVDPRAHMPHSLFRSPRAGRRRLQLVPVLQQAQVVHYTKCKLGSVPGAARARARAAGLACLPQAHPGAA
mmetsp:Transcript_17951/g.69527  ORF Transcript_17951/g.69527 Transcript_17951/m.69527 type:complete len:228 (+) Transcript_17951:844-1527(+)